jgi:hypothetical protein
VVLGHVAQRLVAPGLGRGRVALGVGVLGRADGTGEERGLGQRELLHVLAEVGARGGLDAVRAAPEVNGVEVALEDLLLGELTLQLQREHRLLDLAGERALLAEVGVLHVLLGQRRRTLEVAPAQEVVDRRARDAEGVDAVVVEEVVVLGGDDGVDDHLRHLGDGDRLSVGRPRQIGDRLAVGVKEGRGLVLVERRRK